jgi:hypothetical protein
MQPNQHIKAGWKAECLLVIDERSGLNGRIDLPGKPFTLVLLR